MLDRKVCMKLTNKVKAAGATAGLVIVAFLTAGAIELIMKNVSAETFGMICGGLVCFGFLYLTYQVLLARFDYEDSVKRMVDGK